MVLFWLFDRLCWVSFWVWYIALHPSEGCDYCVLQFWWKKDNTIESLTFQNMATSMENVANPLSGISLLILGTKHFLFDHCFVYFVVKTWSILKSTYAKVHGSVSMDALQRKEAEESACGIKCTTRHSELLKFVFRKNYCVIFWWKMEITDLLAWFWKCQCTISSKYSCSNEEVFDAKIISYSELGFASRILHHKFMLHGLWCNDLMSHGYNCHFK